MFSEMILAPPVSSKTAGRSYLLKDLEIRMEIDFSDVSQNT